MIRISQLKLPYPSGEEALLRQIADRLHIPEKAIGRVTKRKYSIDARKKPVLSQVYTVDVEVDHALLPPSESKRNRQNIRITDDESLVRSRKDPDITLARDVPYVFPKAGEKPLKNPPVIAGAGPAGLFCGYMLACHGYRPIILERGRDVDSRTEDVEAFWRGAPINPDSNVQFGEGGAGTFSDGKLNTQVKDKYGRNRKVLEIFCEHGAPEEILYLAHPHIGTDLLRTLVKNLRNHILELGGQVHFESQVTGITYDEKGHVAGVVVRRCVENPREEAALQIHDSKDGVQGTLESAEMDAAFILPTEVFIPAIGHSARDTFQMLYENHVPMKAKSFACGVRVEHPQRLINKAQYGLEELTADYKLTANLENGRGVYSFCMCPGGYVVNASSEEGHLAVNGMSYHDRGSKNANSAIIVTVDPEDFGYTEGYPLELQGIAFQRKLERRAFLAGGGKIPVQRYEDFVLKRPSSGPGTMLPQMKGDCAFTDVRGIFPDFIGDSICEAMPVFDIRISGFADKDVLFSGVESRTSSPVRILRDDHFESDVKGIFPCGEGAGYAGGITSAAMDGIRIAEEIAGRYSPGL